MALTIRRYGAADGLSSSSWMPIAPPDDFNNLNISNREGSDDVLLCTDPNDAGTIVTLPKGSEQAFAVPVQHKYAAVHFPKGVPALWVKPDSGSGPIIAIWL